MKGELLEEVPIIMTTGKFAYGHINRNMLRLVELIRCCPLLAPQQPNSLVSQSKCFQKNHLNEQSR